MNSLALGIAEGSTFWPRLGEAQHPCANHIVLALLDLRF